MRTRSTLPSTEQVTMDQFKTALQHLFSSAPARKHPDQKHEADDDDHSRSHIREDQVWPAGSQRQIREWSDQHPQEEQETISVLPTTLQSQVKKFGDTPFTRLSGSDSL